MLRSIAASVALSVALSSSGLAAQSTVKPEAVTPADGQVQQLFQEWLTAFDSGDLAAIKAYYVKYLNDDNPMFALENAYDTCGFDTERVEASSATTMTVLVRQRCLPGLQRVKLELAADGTKFKALDFRPLPLLWDGSITATASIADRLSARNDFAGSIIIARGGKNLLARAWGLADPTARTAMTLDTPMFLASAGKMFTAVAIFQLVDAGKVDLDAPMGRYLTDYPNAETAKVTWPTRRETITTTIMVLIMATVLAIFFTGVDAFLGAWLRPGSGDNAGIVFMLLGGRTMADVWEQHTAALIVTLPLLIAAGMALLSKSER